MRDPRSRFSAPMQMFLDNLPLVTPTPSSNAGASQKAQRQNTVTNGNASHTRGQSLPQPGQGSTSSQAANV